jgi:hypothetical protein
VARAFVFHRYQQFCIDMRIESTSQSAFGRILKDVFPNVRPAHRAAALHRGACRDHPRKHRAVSADMNRAFISLASKKINTGQLSLGGFADVCGVFVACL